MAKLNLFCSVFVFLLTTVGFSQTGPGGVGTNDGTSPLKIWYNTTNGVVTTGTTVDSLKNLAGVPVFDIGESGAQRPTLATSSINGYDEVSFSGSNRLRTGLTLTPANFIVNQASSFLVTKADNTSQRSTIYTTDPLTGAARFSNHIPWSGTVYYDIGNCCGANTRIQVGGLAGLNNYSFWSYDAHPGTGKQLYRNGTLLQSRPNTTNYSGHASQRFNLGGNISGAQGFRGDITELIIFNERVNQAQRLIIENYLAAKYGLNSTTNDIYDEDDMVNGNFDHDVAGIGRIDAANLHNDAQGTGIIRISGATDMGDNEFLLWGHNNGTLSLDNSIDVPDTISERLDRLWKVSEASTIGGSVDVGGIDIQVNMTGVTGFSPSRPPQLLVDQDNNGSFANELAVATAIPLGNNLYRFNGITALADNLSFTFAQGIQTVITNRRITYDVNKD
ncbi:MAG: hypothetical protein AAFX53_02715 [Bacteroidota bacterium]